MYTTKKKLLPTFKIITTLFLAFCLFSCSKSDKVIEDDKVIEEEVVEEVDPVVIEADFYIEPESYAVVKNLVTDYGADIIFSTDDSIVLQTAIDDVNSLGGGRLIIPEGNYSFAEIDLKSNVHIEIDANVVIRPTDRPNNRNYAMFKLRNELTNIPLENISISGVNGMFTVDLTQTAFKKIRVIQSWNVENFKFMNMLVEDDHSTFAAIEFNGIKIGGTVYGPKFGLVKNIKANNQDYGYGIVQIQLASNIYFNNLNGIGGTTLRIETHNEVLQEEGIYEPPTELYARNIISEKGNSAVMLSPHFVDCGLIDFRDITSIGSGFAVRVENGFTTSYEAALGLTAGGFHPESIIRNVTATYASSNAQLKQKHFKYMPCELRDLIDTTPIPPFNVSYLGPSIAGLVNNATTYSIDVSEDHVTGIGFKEGWNYVDDNDIVGINNCK